MTSEPAWVSRMRAVDWASLDTCYGKATNVSELIETIAFGDETNTRQAYNVLSNELEHQGSLYPATYEAIPFLIKAAEVCKPNVRRDVLKLLRSILESATHWIEMAEKDSNPDCAHAYRQWNTKYIVRMWSGSDLFAGVLHRDDDMVMRVVASYLLGLLLTHGPSLVPADQSGRYARAVATLMERLGSKEADPFGRTSAVFALGRACRHDHALIEHLRAMRRRPDVAEVIRVAAALSVVEFENGKYADLEEVDLLIDTMCRARETDFLLCVPVGTGDLRPIPWSRRSRLRFRLCEVLCDWSAGQSDRMERVLPALLTGVRLASDDTVGFDLSPVLQWLWPERKPTFVEGKGLERVWPSPITASDVTAFARRVIEACCENPRLWQRPVSEMEFAFRHVGLPERRAGLKVLLDDTA